MSDTVLWNKDEQDAFVTLTLNRPDKMNAMNQELGDALEAAIERAVKDPEVRAVIMNKIDLGDRDNVCIISGESIFFLNKGDFGTI